MTIEKIAAECVSEIVSFRSVIGHPMVKVKYLKRGILSTGFKGLPKIRLEDNNNHGYEYPVNDVMLARNMIRVFRKLLPLAPMESS